MISGKVTNKSETLCRKIVAILSDNNIKPIKTNIDNTSFEVTYKYARGKLIISGKNLDNNKTKEVTIWYLDNRLILKKSHCTLKNITEALITILKKDNLPRCPKCGSRPKHYHEYHCYSITIDYTSLPRSMPPKFGDDFYLFAFSDEDEDEEATERSTYLIAECCCGNQWKLKNFDCIHDICRAYKEGNK